MVESTHFLLLLSNFNEFLNENGTTSDVKFIIVLLVLFDEKFEN